DIGATSREEAEQLVRVGDVGVWNGAPVELPNGRLMSRSLDNRLGAYVALEAVRRVAQGGGAQVDVVAVAVVQEEIGLYGARAAALRAHAELALRARGRRVGGAPRGRVRAASAGRAVVHPLRSTLAGMARSVIVNAVRTPFGRLGGGLQRYEATQLGATVIKA